MNDLSCGVRIWAFCFVAMLAFDRQTDRRTEMPSQYRALHYMQSQWYKMKIFIHHDGERSRWSRVYKLYVSASSVGGLTRRQRYYWH